jgi:hypothetical protein
MGLEADQGAARAGLERLRAAVIGDAALCAALAQIWRPDLFAARLAEVAEARRLRLGAGEIEALLQARPAFPQHVGAAPPGWLPVDVVASPGPAAVRWAWFGERRLVEPSYSESVIDVVTQPFNRLFGFATPLAELTPPPGALAPAGLVFHMSRCGSTLVSQMLAASDANFVISEAPPIDAVVRLDRGAAGLAEAGHAALLRAMALVFGQVRGGGERRCFIKLDSWHMCAAPLFRAAFPATPWVFLYRDPTEVMVSHMRLAGMQMSPEHLPPSVVGLAEPVDGPAEGPADYRARVLGQVCAAALSAHRSGGGLLVNYSELPRALAGRILPHFGAPAAPEEIAVMEAAAARDAKHPENRFAPDAAAKQAAATPAIRAAVGRHLADVYAQLEAARGD